MAKIGIYIPDDKMPEINRWRRELNLSEIFREAFDAAVQQKQRTLKAQGQPVRAIHCPFVTK